MQDALDGRTQQASYREHLDLGNLLGCFSQWHGVGYNQLHQTRIGNTINRRSREYGVAGTGKSYMAKEIARELLAAGRKVCLAAPTHAVAALWRDIEGLRVGTLASGLGGTGSACFPNAYLAPTLLAKGYNSAGAVAGHLLVDWVAVAQAN